MRSSPTLARSSGSSMPRPSRGPGTARRSCPRAGCGGPGTPPRPPARAGRPPRAAGAPCRRDELVGVPRLAVVGEVGALDGLELHPEVAVVVLDHVARRGRAGHDRPRPLAGEHRRTHRLPPRVLEDDLGLGADQAADVLAEAAPLRLVLGVLVRPEAVVRRLAVDHGLDPEVVEQLDLLGRGHDADRRAAAVEHVLDGVAAEATAGPPDQHLVALGHAGPVRRDEHPIGGRVAQSVDGRLLPAEVRRLGHELVRFDDGDVGQPSEVGLEAPDALVGRQHGVVVGRGVLVVDVVALDRDLVAHLPVAHRRACPQHDAGGVRADHVVVERVAGRPGPLLGEAVEEAERGERLEDRSPDRVEVDRRRHDRHVGLVGGQLGQRHLLDVEGPAGVLVGGLHALEHVDLAPLDDGGTVGVGQGECGQLFRAGAVQGSLQDVAHVTRR